MSPIHREVDRIDATIQESIKAGAEGTSEVKPKALSQFPGDGGDGHLFVSRVDDGRVWLLRTSRRMSGRKRLRAVVGVPNSYKYAPGRSQAARGQSQVGIRTTEVARQFGGASVAIMHSKSVLSLMLYSRLSM